MTKSYDQWKFEKENIPEEVKKQEEVIETFNPILLREASGEGLEYDWVWESVIAKGQATLMTCLIKSGKSTFIRCLLNALYLEEEFLGFPTFKCNVLVISEETISIWKSKSTDFDIEHDDFDLWIVKPGFYGKPKAKDWGEFITNKVHKFCVEKNISFIVIDTLSRFWSVDNENDASQTNAALLPLEKLKDSGIACLLIQQSNKQGGGFTNSIRGSTEIGGWADEVIMFSRIEGDHQKSRRRQMDFYGRLYDSPDKLIIRLEHDNKYIAEGNKYQVLKSARLEVVVGILKGSLNPLTVKEIRDLWSEEEFGSKPGDDAVRRYIADLIAVSKLRLVDEVMSGKRKVSRYGIHDWNYSEQLTATLLPPSLPAAVSSVNPLTKPEINSTHRSPKGEENVVRLVNSEHEPPKPDPRW